MAAPNEKNLDWDESGEQEFKKFTEYVSHCRDFAETIAGQKNHEAVTGEDVADAIQMYAALWARLASKKKKAVPSAAAKARKAASLAEPEPEIDEDIQRQIDDLKKFIREEQWESGDSGFGDPKARIAHWKKEIEELKKPKK